MVWLWRTPVLWVGGCDFGLSVEVNEIREPCVRGGSPLNGDKSKAADLPPSDSSFATRPLPTSAPPQEETGRGRVRRVPDDIIWNQG
ncbi:hypothetical protein SKAU_G00267090 [Synaphobranchus kaupii]|uniref:Uncharacterized protein n=1 Tax=Synaphobranchus kaupii TaxID=118154 RepID=A0A9Q1IPA0_SYNKA|nr:hypothetical protein SKAU_G00267090 [Synaphobranchus kaupii]